MPGREDGGQTEPVVEEFSWVAERVPRKIV